MRLGDTILGGLFAIVGVVLTLAGWSLPNLPNQSYGAATFPVVIGIGLAALGVVMAIKGIVAGGGLSIALEDWGRVPLSWLRLFATIGLVVLYVLYSHDLGFVLAGTALLLALLVIFRAPLLLSVVIAPLATLAVAWSFGNMLRVPLPRGILSGLW